MKTSFSVPTPVPGVEVQCENTVATPVIDVAATVTPATEIPTAPVSNTALAPTRAPELPVAVSDSPIEFDDNDIKFEDIYLPRVNIVQKVGDLSLVFTPGEIVLNQVFVIHTPADDARKVVGEPPLNVIVLGFKKKQYAEKVSGGAQGLLVNSEAEVVKAGGTLAYKEWEQSLVEAKTNPAAAKKYFQPLATALILVEKPAHVTDDTQFSYECEGKFYALGLWSMKGTSYTNAAKHFFTARKIGHLKAGYPVRSWTLTTKCEKYGSNFAHIPVLRPGVVSTPAFLAFVKEVLGCGSN